MRENFEVHDGGAQRADGLVILNKTRVDGLVILNKTRADGLVILNNTRRNEELTTLSKIGLAALSP